jgi:hypothetical protein
MLRKKRLYAQETCSDLLKGVRRRLEDLCELRTFHARARPDHDLWRGQYNFAPIAISPGISARSSDSRGLSEDAFGQRWHMRRCSLRSYKKVITARKVDFWRNSNGDD